MAHPKDIPRLADSSEGHPQAGRQQQRHEESTQEDKRCQEGCYFLKDVTNVSPTPSNESLGRKNAVGREATQKVTGSLVQKRPPGLSSAKTAKIQKVLDDVLVEQA